MRSIIKGGSAVVTRFKRGKANYVGFFSVDSHMYKATTLNVAINSSNKALLTIMMSNNFVELKGSVFKKFDKNNLFQAILFLPRSDLYRLRCPSV